MRAEDWHALQPYITSAGYRYRTLGDALREGAEEGLGYSCFDAEWSEDEKAELVPSRVSAHSRTGDSKPFSGLGFGGLPFNGAIKASDQWSSSA